MPNDKTSRFLEWTWHILKSRTHARNGIKKSCCESELSSPHSHLPIERFGFVYLGLVVRSGNHLVIGSFCNKRPIPLPVKDDLLHFWTTNQFLKGSNPFICSRLHDSVYLSLSWKSCFNFYSWRRMFLQKYGYFVYNPLLLKKYGNPLETTFGRALVYNPLLLKKYGNP